MTKSELGRVAAAFRGVSHPTRIQILEALRNGAPLSPAELVREMTPRRALGSVSHHTRELRTLGLVRPAGTEAVRGALQHFYRLSPLGEQLMEFADRVPRR